MIKQSRILLLFAVLVSAPVIALAGLLDETFKRSVEPVLGSSESKKQPKQGGGQSGQANLIVPANAIDGRYIVVLKENSPLGLNAVQSVATQLVRQYGGVVDLVFGTALNGFAAQMTESQASALSRDAKVHYVEQDSVMKLSALQQGPTWGLDRIDQPSLPLDRQFSPDNDAEGVHLYIIDTGVRFGHREFSGRMGRSFNAAARNGEVPSGEGGLLGGLGGLTGSLFGGGGNDDDDGGETDPAEDCNGHGTHVAASAAGSEYGVAKKATIHAVRVLDCNGSGSNSGVIKGVDWVASNAQFPAVANMSLGGGSSTALDEAVNAAIDQGITVVVAAGNDNKDACEGSPNRVDAALTVGATDKQDKRSDFSNWGRCVDIFAPGSEIKSAWHTGDDATKTIQGTSMAAPHVAGVAALYLFENKDAKPKAVFDALIKGSSEGQLSDLRTGSPNRLLQLSQ